MPNRLIFLLCLGFLIPGMAGAAEATQRINGIDTTQTMELPFTAIGGIAHADLGNDGISELIVTAGFDEAPTVSVLRLDGSLIHSFEAYAPGFKRGVTVAAGDVDGDGMNEIVTGTMLGGGPHVRVFKGNGNLVSQFFAFDADVRTGVEVATADIDGDGTDEIIASAGLGGGPHVRIFLLDGTLQREFFAFDANETSGATVTRIDSDQDGRDELVIARLGDGTPEARIARFTPYDITLSEPFPLYGTSFRHGVTLFPVDSDRFGVTPNGHGGPHVRMFTADGEPVYDAFAFDDTVRDRILSTALSPTHVISLRTRPLLSSRREAHIYVNLDEQRLYAYNEQGVPLQTFLISAARWPWRTPTGEFEVMRKLRWHDYRWTYGDNDPRNYDIKDVEYNLEFTRHFYIHHAYWHSNWGNPMSHGCVNAPYEGVQWVYEWADVGTPVIVK